MSVADPVSEFLQIGVISRLEALVELCWLFPYFIRRSMISRVTPALARSSAGSVEFDILGRIVSAFVKEVAVNVEHFHCEAARLRNAVLFLHQRCECN
jgi:hypothetical protein